MALMRGGPWWPRPDSSDAVDQRQAWQRFPHGLYDRRRLALAALEAVVSRQETTSRRRRTRCCVARCRPVGGGEPRRASTFDNRPTWDNPGASFDNRPTWDDWSKSK
ncbi:multiple cyclophane-containing RiPP AmcA [Streptomyces sp. NPDC047718]|uniref:multiple cyclophane-containing RiPP AmcA n=1 Tax=Streptomyces sp. NPDC047718 TaxID=3155479 RepID=UPI0033FF952D